MIDTKFSGSKSPLYFRRIKCPAHFILRPGGVPFVMERDPALKNIKDADMKAISRVFGRKISAWRPKKDRYGNKIYNVKDYYQPEISASWAKENVYRKDSHICQRCRRCLTK